MKLIDTRLIYWGEVSGLFSALGFCFGLRFASSVLMSAWVVW